MGCGCSKKQPRPTIEQQSLAAPMSLSLVDRHTVPNGGFTFYEARTRTRLTAPTAHYLADLIIRHRKANEIPCGTIDETLVELEDQICLQAPPGTCRDKEGVVKMNGTVLNFDTITRGAATLWDWFTKHGRKRVDKQTATERARICGNCFANRRPEGCTSCASGWLRELSEKFVGGEETPHDPLIHSCSFCGCQLRSLIWMPIEVLRDHTPQSEKENLPDFCWKRRELNGEKLCTEQPTPST